MKWNSFAKLGGVAAFAALVLAGCGSSNSFNGGSSKTLNWSISTELPTMDISKSTDLYSGQTINATGEGLLRYTGNSKVGPGVATSYKVSNGGKTWTFNLRKSQWSNGTPVTANDFVYSWQRTVTPKTASQYAYIFANIQNAAQISAGKMAPSKLGVKASGNNKLVVNLVKPQSYFKYMVAMSTFFPMNKAQVTKEGSKYGTNDASLLSNGPYVLKNWNSTKDSWYLSKNPKYWNAKNVKLSKINFTVIKDPSTALNSYNGNKIDYTTLNGVQVKQYKNKPGFENHAEASTFYMVMNQKKDPIFKSADARKAISLAIDKHHLVNTVLADGSLFPKGFVASQMITKNGTDFADAASVPEAVSYNMKQAKALWAKAEKATGQKSFNFNYVADDTTTSKNISQYVQNQLEQLPGVKVNNQNLPFANRLNRQTKGQFDITVAGWIADYPDPSDFLDLMTSKNSYNYGHWSNAQYDALVKKSESTDANNEAARWSDMVQAEKVLMKDQGVVPLYQQSLATLTRSNVKGVLFIPTSPEIDWTSAYMK